VIDHPFAFLKENKDYPISSNVACQGENTIVPLLFLHFFDLYGVSQERLEKMRENPMVGVVTQHTMHCMGAVHTI
jgi:hypothetical protein